MQEEHIKVYSSDAIFINRLNSILNKEGITSLIKDQVESGRLGGFGVPYNSVDLFVFLSDVEKAKEIIKKFEEEIKE